MKPTKTEKIRLNFFERVVVSELHYEFNKDIYSKYERNVFDTFNPLTFLFICVGIISMKLKGILWNRQKLKRLRRN